MELLEAYEVLGVSAQTPLIEVKNSYEEAKKQIPKTTVENKAMRKKLTLAYETILINQDMDQEFENMWKRSNKKSDSIPMHRNTYKRFIYSIITVLILLNLIPYIGGLISRLQGIEGNHTWSSFQDVQDYNGLLKPAYTDYELGYKDGVSEAFHLAKDVTFSVSKFELSDLHNWFYIEENNMWTVIIPLKVETTNQEKALINAQQFKLGDLTPVTEIKENIHLNEKLNSIYYLTEFDTAIPIGTTFGLIFTVPPFENKEERVLTYDNGAGSSQDISLLQFNESGEDDLWKLNLQFVDVATHKGWY